MLESTSGGREGSNALNGETLIHTYRNRFLGTLVALNHISINFEQILQNKEVLLTVNIMKSGSLED